MAVYFFGYDKVLYQFGFDSEEVRCVIVDKTINEFAEIRRAVVKDIKVRDYCLRVDLSRRCSRRCKISVEIIESLEVILVIVLILCLG
jgi:hypothetical protein